MARDRWRWAAGYAATGIMAGALVAACAPLENEDIGGGISSAGATDGAESLGADGGDNGDGDGDGDGDSGGSNTGSAGDGDGDGDGDGAGVDCDIDPTPGMVCVPDGPFTLGDDEGEADEQPAVTVSLMAFEIDINEVSVGAYGACVVDGACTVPASDAGCTYGMGAADGLPVNCVTWDQASAYCAWAGKRLPSEAEWEKAARGAAAQTYPWGEMAPACTLANFDDGGGPGCGAGIAAVGSLLAGESPYGALDMAGNVAEWVGDWYDAGYYATAPSDDPLGPATGTERSVRGGGFQTLATGLRSADRTSADPATYAVDRGFRCAR